MLVLVGAGRALGTLWRLSTDTSLVIGRKDSSLLIEGDKSVSRVHATISILAEDLSGVDVQDEGSKFGIYINGKRCPTRSISRLCVGDKIMFGAQDSVFHLRSYPIALCVANMRSESPASVDRVLAIANSLGMDIVDDIERCTHLVMPVLAITTKLIRALVFGCRVVAPEYIYSLEALPLSFKIQNPTLDLVDEFAGSLKFMPPAHAPVASPESPVDLSAVNWSPDNMRQCLFESKLFAFAEASQMNKYASLIKAAGGSGVLLKGAVDWAGSHSRSTESFQACCASLVDKVQALAREAKGTSATLPLKCLVLPPSPPPLPADRDVQSDFDVAALVSTVARLLGVRPISESEIGLAVLFVSSETHTNPVHGLLPSVPLRVTEAQTSSTTVETGEARQEDLVSTTALEPAGLPRRRRVPRISNFWNDKVATDASAILASDSMPSANLENARVSMEALSVASPTGPAAPVSEPAALEPEPELARPRRRVGVEGFWANAVSGSSQAARALDEGQQPTADSMDNVPSVPDVSAGVESGAQAASAPVRTITEYQQHHGAVAVERVSLVRRKQYPAACQAEHSSGAPNYKRFKKTVHPYQLV